MMCSEPKPFVLEPGGGSAIRNPVGGHVVFKLRGEQSNGAMTVIETAAAPLEGPPVHFHGELDEFLYVLAGEFRFRLGDDLVPGPVGSFAFIPRNTVHTWQNVGRDRGVLLGLIAPAGLERFFEGYAAMAASGKDSKTFAALAPEADITIVGPPLAQSYPTMVPTGS
jgi:quercetin dioxygenase-like cupin family protein